jgi:hypothetical protein
MLNTLTFFRSCPRKFAWALFSLVCVAATSGCTVFQGLENAFTYNDASNDFVLGWRNSVWARQAWHERKNQFVGESQFYDFGEGFRSGYENVASGGNGCPPGMAPRGYWNWKYQSPEGQAKVAAWFAGYPHGARAAEEDGAGLYQQIQISGAMERQYAPEFVVGATVPAEEIPPGQQAPNAVPPAPLPTDSSANVSASDLRTRGLTAYQSTSTVGQRAANAAYVAPQSQWPVITQASAIMPVSTANLAFPQQGVQQTSAIAR